MKNKKFLTIRRIIVTFFLIIFALAIYINFRGSYLEYQELGDNYLQTFLTREKYQYSVIGVNFVVIFLLMYIVGKNIKKGLKVFFEQEKIHFPKLPNKSIAIVVSLIESIIVGFVFTPNIILCASNTSFGSTDAIFNLDVSFYMFIEPLIKMITMYFIGICIATIIYEFVYYIIVFNRYFDGIDKQTLKESPIMKTIYRSIRLIGVGICVLILICSMDIVFDNFMTTDNNIKLAGAGLVDRTLKYWGYNVFAIIILVSIFKAVNDLKKSRQTKILKDLLVIPVYLVFLFIIMLLFDVVFVKSNEFDKEKKYIESNIVTTKKAYGIDCDIKTIDYTGTVTIDEVKNNENVINNTVIVDKKTVLENLEETQKGTGYYTYNTAQLSSYIVDGKQKLVYASPREIISNKRTFNSKTFEYTHGYGLIFTSATEATLNGELKYIQNDITGADNKIYIKTPQIYYGLETNTTVVTNAKNKKEFDYADGDKEYESSYSQSAGISLNFIDRLILGIKEKNINIAFSSSVMQDSKLLINRNIIKRAKIALSDIVYDEHPYTVVDENGDIFWVLDGYTISSSYPYSTYTEIEYNGQKRGINYIRNSIKVIINSYTGKMQYYITDRTDPIAMAYRKVYPNLFENLDNEIPQSIQEQIIYPQFLYNVQTTMLEEYHNTKADVLYRSDDTWSKATYKNMQNSNKTANILAPYYTMVKSQDGKNQIGLIQMYTQKDKQSLTAYLIGTVEKGKNTLYLNSLYSDTTILGPTQLDIQISQDETIQKQIDNLSVTGAKVTKNMIILPIENTILYIEPIYQTLVNETNLPILKKVIVASGNKVAIGNNLQEAVENLISQYATSIEIESTEDLDGIIEALIKANDNLTKSLNSNNWELMGADIQKMQSLIKTLEKQVDEDKKQKNKNIIEDVTEENIIEENTTKENIVNNSN